MRAKGKSPGSTWGGNTPLGTCSSIRYRHPAPSAFQEFRRPGNARYSERYPPFSGNHDKDRVPSSSGFEGCPRVRFRDLQILAVGGFTPKSLELPCPSFLKNNTIGLDLYIHFSLDRVLQGSFSMGSRSAVFSFSPGGRRSTETISIHGNSSIRPDNPKVMGHSFSPPVHDQVRGSKRNTFTASSSMPHTRTSEVSSRIRHWSLSSASRTDCPSSMLNWMAPELPSRDG